MSRSFIVTLSCPNRTGIVRAVSAFLFEQGCDIVEYQQFDDPISGRLFLRSQVCAPGGVDLDAVSREFASVAADFG